MQQNFAQQNLAVLNWGCRLIQVYLYNGHKMVVVVVVKMQLLLTVLSTSTVTSCLSCSYSCYLCKICYQWHRCCQSGLLL